MTNSKSKFIQGHLFDMTVAEPELIIKGAAFSDCRKWRYALWRIWDKRFPLVMFIGLNPSTANEQGDDATIRRAIAIAKNLGYGGLYMMNLYAIVSRQPSYLKTCKDPLGDNDKWLDKIAYKCGDIIYAWGNFPIAKERAAIVQKRYPNAKALIINKNGTPRHPLFVPVKIIPVKFK